MSALQVNYKLISPLRTSHSLILQNKVLSQECYAAIFLCPHDIFRRGLLLLHHTFLGQVTQLFCLKITGEHGTIFTSPVIVINKGRHERFTQR